jgi:polyhydroxybutyrate depolymerase
MKLVRQLRFSRTTGQMRRLFLAVGACVTLAACSSPAVNEPVVPEGHAATAAPAVTTGTTTVQRQLTVDGMKRTYLAVGSSLRHKGLPLLIMLHGRGITAQLESARTGFLPYAERGLVNIVYPLGISQSWNAGHGCCGAAAKEGVPDTAFITQVAADASRYFASDLRRIYLVGYSNGAKLSFEEVCEHPGTFAALATYGAVPLAPCAGGKPISALLASGTNDAVVRSEHFSPTATIALDQAVAQWQARNGCPGAGTASHTGPLTLRSWTGCAAGTQLSAAVYSGLTHFWPTATHTNAPYTTDVGEQAAAATIMWDFLSRQHLA